MIRFLSHDEVDVQRWDQCIACAVNARVYACSWYLNILSPGWCALVMGEYDFVMPLPETAIAGFRRCLQPFFSQQLGVFGRFEPTPEIMQEFLNAVPKEYFVIDLQLNESNPFVDSDYEWRDRTNHLLDLSAPYEVLKSGYGSQAKRNLKRAAEAGLVRKDADHKFIVDFYRHWKSEETAGVKPGHYQRLTDLLLLAGQQNLLLGYQITDKKNVCLAAAAYLLFGGRLVFLIGNASPGGKEIGAMTMLMDSVIQDHAGRSLTFDFEGSDNPGIARFFKSFGAKPVAYHRVQYRKLPRFFRIFGL